MPRLRRAASALVPVLLIPALVACGGTKTGYGDKTASGFDAVSISGDVGKKPSLTWKAALAYPSTMSVRTLVKGSGVAVTPASDGGKGALAELYIGDGTTEAKDWGYSSAQPEAIATSMGDVFKQLLDGARVGDRRAVIAKSEDVFGSGDASQYGIGNHDALVVVADIVADPTPKDVSASKLPRLQQKGGKPSGFSFSGVSKPSADGSLLRAVVKKGTGKTVTQDMTVTANYLGMTYGASKPFDESYSAKPVPFPLANVVPGWTYGLEGLKVGSRVLLQIPPALGYGAKAQKPNGKGHAGIPANSTLYFVIDIVSAKKTPASSSTQGQ